MATHARKAPGVFLTTQWRYLAMLSYAVDPALLAPHLPAGLELDLWNGRPYASLVGFVFRDTRLLGIPIPFHRSFPELNLRFYVRRPGAEERTGLVFVREFVPRRAVSFIARLAYNENFHRLPMRSRIDEPDPRVGRGPNVEYSWRLHGSWNRLRMECAGAPGPPQRGSLDEFVLSRRWGYTRQRDGGCLEYRVEHAPWNIWHPQSVLLDCDAGRMYGPGWADVFRGSPDSALLADGSPIVLYRGERIGGGQPPERGNPLRRGRSVGDVTDPPVASSRSGRNNFLPRKSRFFAIPRGRPKPAAPAAV